jgi:RNA polymerase sigma-70 factor (ECF subfamily)
MRGTMELRDVSKELLRKASDGDLDAFGEIYKAASGFVFNVALRVTGNHEDALESTQETFIKIFKHLRKFKFESSFKTWIYRITVNTALDIRKKTGMEANRRVQLDDEFDLEKVDFGKSNDNSAELNIEDLTNKETVERMLRKLNPDQRAVIVLRDMEGMSYEDIARTLQINKNTVRSRLKRARETLVRRGG